MASTRLPAVARMGKHKNLYISVSNGQVGRKSKWLLFVFMSHESLVNVVIYTAIDLNSKLCAVSVLVHAFSVLVCYSIPFSTAPKQ